MKEWRTSLPLKVAAVVLFAVFLTGAGLSLFGVVCGIDMGIYDGVTDPMESSFVYGAASGFGYEEILNSYVNGVSLKELTAYSASDRCNFAFALYETDAAGRERLLASTFDANSRMIYSDLTWDGGMKRDWTDTEPNQDVDYDLPDVDYGMPDEGEDKLIEDEAELMIRHLRLEVGVKTNIPNRAGYFYNNIVLFQWISVYRNELIAILVASVLLGLADFILLCCMAGHRKGQTGIVCNRVDRIPFDLYAGAACVPFCVLLFTAVEGCLRELRPLLNVFGFLCMVAAAMVVLAVVLSFVTRVKAGQWWRNTVIFRVLRWGWRLFRRCTSLAVRVVRAIPLVWRSGIVTAGLLLVLCFLGGTESWGIFFLLSIIILAAVILAAYELRLLQRGGEALASGDFEAKVDTARMFWDFKRHGENLNAVGKGMSLAVEERMKSERLKTELITNVSHDIKTPLTSIINYVDLLQKPHTEEEEKQYLEVLDRQSARLKKLTEDLVEASKASTGNLPVDLRPANVSEALDQALAEYQERLTAGEFQIVTVYPDRETSILADGRLLWRVLDNLLNNVCKYALPGTRVYVTFERTEKRTVRIAVKNISRQALNISADELIERFVRGDTARSTEGSGLGLNIAKSLAELQGGRLQLTVDGDLFKAELEFPLSV